MTGWLATLAAGVTLLGACSAPLLPPTAAPASLRASPSAIMPGHDSGSPGAVPGAPCTADITVSGEYRGTVAGPVPSQVRRIGEGGRGLSVDMFLDLPQADGPARFMFSLFDADGAGPKPVVALFGQVEPDITSRGWEEGRDAGSATLADDGSQATFDLAFTDAGIGPTSTVSGSLACEALPAAGG